VIVRVTASPELRQFLFAAEQLGAGRVHVNVIANALEVTVASPKVLRNSSRSSQSW